jgi:hypothetical protein
MNKAFTIFTIVFASIVALVFVVIVVSNIFCRGRIRVGVAGGNKHGAGGFGGGDIGTQRWRRRRRHRQW